MTEKYETRGFRGDDLVPLRALIHRTIDACYSGVYPPRAVEFFKAYHSEEKIRERSREGEILAVEREGDPVATGAVVGGEISGLFVRPDFQGCGIGAALMRELEEKAKAGGHDAAELSVSLPSRGFYGRLGYRITDARSIDVGEGQRLDYWQAEKHLDGNPPPFTAKR
jgi:GNAT superfamily N-acetyltransferase